MPKKRFNAARAHALRKRNKPVAGHPSLLCVTTPARLTDPPSRENDFIPRRIA